MAGGSFRTTRADGKMRRFLQKHFWVSCIGFIVLMVVGYLPLLYGDNPTEPPETTDLEVYASFIGLLLFVTSLTGLVYTLSLARKPMSPEQKSHWGTLRLMGKRKYVQRGLFLYLVNAIIAFVLLAAYDYFQGQFFTRNLITYVIIFFSLAGITVYCAHMWWDYQEYEYKLPDK
jgi:hypothetical protein